VVVIGRMVVSKMVAAAFACYLATGHWPLATGTETRARDQIPADVDANANANAACAVPVPWLLGAAACGLWHWPCWLGASLWPLPVRATRPRGFPTDPIALRFCSGPPKKSRSLQGSPAFLLVSLTWYEMFSAPLD
jgi:hypothetical protein